MVYPERLLNRRSMCGRALSLALVIAMLFSMAAPASAGMMFGVVRTEDEFSVGELTGGDGTYEVRVAYGEGAGLPEGARLVTYEIAPGTAEFDRYLAAVEKTAEDGVDTVFTRFFEIGLTDKDGAPIQPLAPVEVTVTVPEAEELPEDGDVTVVHFPEEDPAEPGVSGLMTDLPLTGIGREDALSPDVMPEEEPASDDFTAQAVASDAPRMETVDADRTGSGLVFMADGFSVYGVIGTVIEKTVLASDGHNYRITVTSTAGSGIPEDADLAVEEILSGSEEYAEYVLKTENALGINEKVTFARFFDIRIVKDGQEIQPTAPVDVKIELPDEVPEDVKAVHFEHDGAKNETPVFLDTSLVKADEMDSAVAFEADSFSVFGVAATEATDTISLTAEGKTLSVSVIFDSREVIAEGAKLDVSEVTFEESPEVYAQRNERLAGVLFEEYGNVAITDVRYLNISVLVPAEKAGESEPIWVEYEPVYPVKVKISYTEPMNTANPGEYADYNDGSMKVTPDIGNHIAGVHYTDAGATILNTADVNTDAGISETLSSADGFSEYDFAYIYEYKIIDTKYDYEPSPIGDVTPNLTALTVMSKPSAGKLLLRATNDNDPAHTKTLADNGDGTSKLSLTVTGDADTDSNTASNANVIIVFDTSNSMINYYVPMANGARGSDSDDGYPSYVLYYLDGNRYREADDGYTGTVYRRNGNNYTPYISQRYSKTIRRADAAEKVLYDFAHALYGYQNTDDPSTPEDESENIQTALITFNRTASTVQNWTSTETDITNRVSSTGNGGSKKLGNSSGTNWEDALRQAQTVMGTADNDPTFVVFITDGQPTQWHGSPSGEYDTAGQGYIEARDEARAVQLACAATGTDSHGALFGIYAYGTEADYLDELMYYAYTGTARDMDPGTVATDGYYNAADSASLTDAINDIFSKIVKTLGITGVSITDGTTSQVRTTTGEISHLLEVDTSSYEYWLTLDTVDNKFSMKDLVSGETIEYTVSSSGSNVTISWSKNGTDYSETYEGTYTAGTARIKWTQGTSFYNYAPPTATFTDPAVNWDLSRLGTLLDGVTYEVTFDVFPSQYTLDLIADLKNGKIEYGELDENIRNYLIKNGSEYDLKTNTTASLTYTDSRLDDPQPTTTEYTNPDPVHTSAAQTLAISKKWENELDGRSSQNIELHVIRDETEQYEVTLNEENNWSGSAYVSMGIMTVHNGIVSIKTPGHDFSFAEPENLAYHWELDVPTVHPMKINGVDTVLLLVTGDDIPEEVSSLTDLPATATVGGATYYKFNYNGGDKVYKVDSASGSLTAVNSRRSNLNITKTVVGGNAPEDAEFKFTVTVTNSKASDGTEDNLNSDYWVWFSVDSNPDPDIFEPVISDTLATGDYLYREKDDGDVYTGYYYVKSGTHITVNLRAGWNLRFTNLPSGSTYSVEESDEMPSESFSFVNVVGEREYYTYSTTGGEAATHTEKTGTITEAKIEGTINHTNSVYTMTYTNKYSSVGVELKKVDEDGGLLDGSEFDLYYYKPHSSGTGGSWEFYGENHTFRPGGTAETNPLSLGGLGIGRYRLTETKAPAGYLILTKHVYFEVYKDGGTLKAKLTDENGDPFSDADTAEISGPAGESPVYTISIVNHTGPVLPSTGSFGTLPILAAGAVLAVGSATTLALAEIRRRRREEE